jgi:hypothetical protein
MYEATSRPDIITDEARRSRGALTKRGKCDGGLKADIATRTKLPTLQPTEEN